MASKYNVKVQFAAWVAVCTLATALLMTMGHFKLVVDALDKATETRATITADSLAKSVEDALLNDDPKALPGIVARVVSDEDVYHMRIVNAAGEPVYRPWNDREPTGLLVIQRIVGAPERHLGVVEVGIAPTETSSVLKRIVLFDLGMGLTMVVLATAVSVYASSPVRLALGQLRDLVKRADAGETGNETLDTDLTEVDQLGRELNRVMHRVGEAQKATARAQEELKAAQKEMDEYTYVISHDLKEPLRGIEAFSKFLMDDYRDKLDDDGQHHIDVIRNSALRMQRLINDLLKFSRLGQQKNSMVTVGLNAMLMHVRLNLQYAIDAKHVDLRVDKLPTVVCETTAMTEVFHNLVSNAIKYNTNDRPVVEVGCVEKVNDATAQEEYEFYVRDNGPGIRPDYFEKIFQLFQRLQRDDEGTGIGLTIVKRVVSWHGGRIWVESEEGKGTTFYFTLPKLGVGAAGVTPTPSPAPTDTVKGEPELASTV